MARQVANGTPALGSVAAAVVDELSIRIDALIADPAAAAAVAASTRAGVPGDIASKIDSILESGKLRAYRDAILIQLAFGRREGGFDHTVPPRGGRSAAALLGKAFRTRHIAGVVDAYQNIAKNAPSLCRGNVPAFDDTLRWANHADDATRGQALEYVLAKVSLTARPVLPMPELSRPRLTFWRCAAFFDELLRIPSGGAYQQFAVAACLWAVIEEFGQGGIGGLRVETKRLNAADASSKVSGDIQIRRGNRVEEAFEVTANDWRTKIAPAVASARAEDLARVHIIAAVDREFLAGAAELAGVPVDLTVIDIAAYLQTLLAVMRKPARAAALVRLYELVDLYQPDIDRTNTYVRLVVAHGLDMASPSA